MNNKNFHIVVENLYNTICHHYPDFPNYYDDFPINDHKLPTEYEMVTAKELYEKLMNDEFEFTAPRIDNIARFGILCYKFLNVDNVDNEKLNLARCLYFAYLYQSKLIGNAKNGGML